MLLLGVLYHLKHPLLALERIRALTRQVCSVETFVIDAAHFRAGTAAPTRLTLLPVWFVIVARLVPPRREL